MDQLSEISEKLNLSTLSVPSLRISDIIDMLLVAALIYIVIKWVKETRAWSLFRGIAMLVIISLLSYNFHFYTLSWIISKTFSVGIIAVIVIFQPELRKALEQLGNRKFFGLTDMLRITDDAVMTEKSVDEIIAACKRMSDARTGALIAIERSVKIMPSSESVRIDGHISRQLLLNIFVVNTPLHDGGVIIRDNRVAYASCIFSVTDSDIGQDLGTRHRAAVGASEDSDALIIVVSEETGAISLADGGRLYRRLSSSQLKKRLLTLVNNQNTKQKPLRKLFKNYSQNEYDKKGRGLGD